MNLNRIRTELTRFAVDRDWQKFHTPANLAKAVSVEAGELLECFLWGDETPTPAAIEEEIADVFIYLLQLSDAVGVDMESATLRKIEANKAKYPPKLCWGKAVKYTDLPS